MLKKLFFAIMLVVMGTITMNAAFLQLKYRGTVAGQRVEVALSYNTGDYATNFKPYWIDDGCYRYVNVGETIVLKPQNYATSKTWIFYEYSRGNYSGKWVVKPTRSGLTGTFYSPRGKKYAIKLTEVTSAYDWEWAY